MKKIIAAILIAVIAVFLAGTRKPRDKPILWEEYTVKSGDTVSEISLEITPVEEDWRYTVYYINEKNEIKNSMIYPGQVLLVPVWEE